MTSATRSTVLATSTALPVLALDLATKAAAAGGALRGRWVDPTANHDLALGLAGLPGDAEAVAAVLGLVVAIVALRRVVGRRRQPVVAIAAGLLLGGTAGNLVDRLAGTGVRDFLVGPGILFNLADVALVVGIALLLVTEARASHPRPVTAAR